MELFFGQTEDEICEGCDCGADDGFLYSEKQEDYFSGLVEYSRGGDICISDGCDRMVPIFPDHLDELIDILTHIRDCIMPLEKAVDQMQERLKDLDV